MYWTNIGGENGNMDFNFNDGGMWVLGPDPKNPEKKEGLALFPVDKTKPTMLNGVFGFSSKKEADEWIEKSSKLNPKTAELMERVSPQLAMVPN